MGGPLPLGYDGHPDPLRRELVINEREAEDVRTLFQLYDQLGNLRLVEAEALRLGLRSKVGRIRGGSPFQILREYLPMDWTEQRRLFGIG